MTGHLSLKRVIPTYMSAEEVLPSEVYLQEDVRLQLDKRYLLLAQSGDGKTSLLNILYGNNRHFHGSVDYPWGNSLAVDSVRKEKFSYVFQDLKLFPSLTALENIQIKNALTGHKSEEEILGMLERVGLKHKAQKLAASLSLGQRQRVAVIRALCQPFQMLLLDEPFSHLDAENSTILVGLIQEELEKQRAGLIMTSLSPSNVFDFDQILKLSLWSIAYKEERFKSPS